MAWYTSDRPVFVFEYETSTPPPPTVPEYTADGQMKLPEHYREWVYLTTGFDMSYSPKQWIWGITCSTTSL